ncbi:tRNA lysidine(34) synthetase TilS [Roseovarius spongiae]|uniref:tRNA(Ile)-lysidine synthase n=1 Tax=Roseovarius spongiae TaxID=2320272 RepID=A0A3A8AWD0_9RHOB|nr:tRNA lysidine(34) synthetase TilS [Roseovarius spongiae]RKF13924.1 tRNA lysidine(34) synthetase TilS [Roseovarius spongiae]
MDASDPRLAEGVAGHFAAQAPARLGVAVSGGSDSLALLHLLHDWNGAALHAVTVDHGLRPEAPAEAVEVARICASLNVPHATLRWEGWDGRGNLSDRARRARYALMADWARGQGIGDIALGHTANDQAETLLMRLARASGIDGLAAMTPRRIVEGVTFHRPLLDMTRADLRADLARRGVAWIDDPTNVDTAYRRARAREALAQLAPLGLDAEGLARSARHLAEARATLAHYAAQEAARAVTFQAGDILLDRTRMDSLRPDIARRILQAALHWIAGPGYGARGREVDRALEAIRTGGKTTLFGCVILPEREVARVTREYAAVRDLRATPGEAWDARWTLTGPRRADGAEVRALGPEGRAACPDWRETGLPLASIEAGPAVWRGASLVAAPLAGLANGWSAALTRDADDFRAFLLSH